MLKSVLTLGTFDGVHRGHQALIRKVIQISRARRSVPVALSFDMPPRHAGKPLNTPVLLTTWAEKQRLFLKYGIRRLVPLRFDRKTALTSAADFFECMMVRKFGAQDIVVGPKLAFGRNREGNLTVLRQLGKYHGVRVHVVAAIGHRAHEVSSRRIRTLLSEGKLDEANKRLGYPYSLEGTVVHGDHRGRTLGFPTANIEPQAGKILPPGVFWVKVLPPSQSVPSSRELRHAPDGICNVGIRPTFHPDARSLHCEVHLLKNTTSLYGKKRRVLFMRKIRSEMKFRSAEALVRQIKFDRRRALLYRKAYFSI